jgi:excisionase family DNA binding protein
MAKKQRTRKLAPNIYEFGATLSVEDAGRVLSIGRSLAYRMAQQGTLPTILLGRRLVVPRAALERMLGLVPSSTPTTG